MSPGIRLDRWLWFARLCRSRSLAARLCEEGRVRVNRALVDKPAHLVRPGDVLTFAQGPRIRVVRVLALGTRRGPPVEAAGLYDDLDP